MKKRIEDIKVLVVGDSWAAIPPKNFIGNPANIASCLRSMGYQVKNLASCGNEMADVYVQRHKILEILPNYDILVVSAGGNDFAGSWDFSQCLTENGKIDYLKMKQKMDVYAAMMLEICEIARSCGKSVVTHPYSCPPVGERGAKFLFGLITIEPKGWLSRYFPPKTPKIQRQEQVCYLLDYFKDVQMTISRKVQNFYPIFNVFHLTWRDEMHLDSESIMKYTSQISEKILKVMNR